MDLTNSISPICVCTRLRRYWSAGLLPTEIRAGARASCPEARRDILIELHSNKRKERSSAVCSSSHERDITVFAIVCAGVAVGSSPPTQTASTTTGDGTYADAHVRSIFQPAARTRRGSVRAAQASGRQAAGPAACLDARCTSSLSEVFPALVTCAVAFAVAVRLSSAWVRLRRFGR